MTHGATQLLTTIDADAARLPAEARPSHRSERAPGPSALQCLRCQVLGRPRLTCTRAAACGEIPRRYPLGLVLLAAWLAIAVGFVVAVA